MLIGLLSFLGVVIGASLQYIFTRHIENQRHIRELRSKEYSDYLRNVAENALIHPEQNGQDRKELLARMADAKTRICLYGSPKTIKAFSAFEELGAQICTPEQGQSFTKMVLMMRSDSGSDMRVLPRDVLNVLLGSHE